MTLAQILVVEDERIVAKGIQSELENMGYAVPDLAASGEEAIELATRLHPDLVLMDIVLRGEMDGIEAARRIRERLDIPVVFLSAYEDDHTLGRAKTTEPFGYLLKPYEEKELHTTIEMALYKHRVEQRVKQAERWLAATLRCIDDAVIATDSRLGVRFLNPIGEALTGWDAGDALGRGLMDVCPLLNGETRDSVDNLATRAIQLGMGIDFPDHCVLRSREGKETPVEGNVSPIYDDEGTFTGVVMVVRDVTERRQLEQMRRQIEEQRRQTDKMEAVSRLAGGVAHDFNNLLTVVLGNSCLVASHLKEDDPNRELLGGVETAALRAARLVEQLLAFSGQGRLFVKPISLNATIEGVLGPLRRLVEPKLTIDFTPGPDPWQVQADRSQLNELLINLCLNAQDAMPEGGEIAIETKNVTREATEVHGERLVGVPGEYVRLRVQDAGRGIPPEVQSRIFEPFYTTKDPGIGVGLGLALVFGIVEQHHGWIECRSTMNQGTVFDIYFPRYWRRPVEKPQPAPVPRTHGGPRTILLADDEPMLRDLARTILEHQGYRVLVAEDGRQAVDIFSKERAHIDIVILDLTMPRLSGKDAWREMVALDPAMRVLFSSGYFAEDVPSDDGTVVGFVNKPYSPHELTEMVRSALERGNEGG